MSTHQPATRSPRPETADTSYRLRSRWPRAAGAAQEIGVFLAVLGLAGITSIPQWQRVTAVVLAGGVALAIRRRWPLLAAAVPVPLLTWAGGALILLFALGHGAGYRVARRNHLYAWLVGFLAAAVAALALAWWRGVPDVWSAGAGRWVQAAIAILLGMLAGQVQAQRHALHAAWRERAERADRDRAIATEQAGLRERARIAQDMHDALGHQLTLISVQAASLEVDPALAPPQRESVQRLGGHARTALDELRAVIGALRPDHQADTLPRRDLAELIERAGAAGLDVNLVRHGQELPLSMMTQHAMYRVVQEGLTNAHKHAPGCPVTVNLYHEPGTVIAEIRNPRPVDISTTAGASGQGLAGLRERVRAVGGLLRAGPDGEDYRVTAILPSQAALTEPDPTPPPTMAAPATGQPAPVVRPAAGWLAIAAIGLLFAAGALASAGTSSVYLSATSYEQIEVGQPEPAVTDRLPGPLVALPPVTSDPPPPDSQCLTFSSARATDWGTGVDGRYRLCFRDGALVEKREFPP